MIVVVNPSSQAGHSFKGLHAYCNHDKDRANTSERVDWVSTRNVGVEDPDDAWKIMLSTARSQNDLKRQSGIRIGKPPKDGAVMHVIMSFDVDEPQDREAMQTAADSLLASLGTDPAKTRKDVHAKPKRRQFADEHQTVMYAHSDTGNTHLHLMVNRIHPQTGVVLPTNNDYKKAQSWALGYSKEHGTADKTPARQDIKKRRDDGELVNGQKRKSRAAYDRDQAIGGVANDNDRLKAFKAEQQQKDTDLGVRVRRLARKQATDWNRLIEDHRQRKSDLSRQLQSQINKAKAAAKKDFRPQLDQLNIRQKAERKTFEAMENSFFGRAANAFKALRVTRESIGGNETGLINRTFKVATDAGVRKQYFAATQERARKLVESEQALQAQQSTEMLKTAQATNFAENRAYLEAERRSLKSQQAEEAQQLKEDWKKRAAEHEEAFAAIPAHELQPQSHASVKEIRIQNEYRSEFDKASHAPAPEQDNTRDSAGDAGGDSSQEPKTDRDSLRQAYVEAEMNKPQEVQDPDHNQDNDDRDR
ncbi:MAG: relaxase/mobilization nuclease domain-containing protein [Rhodobacteraceae bacterium]|nr:relaxase/mobilization nuclease domain-containing protein [Paracoccaceae bacterium]